MAGPVKLLMPLLGIKGISPKFLKQLQKLGLQTVKDLLWHFPARYEDFSQIYKIADLEPGQQATIQAVVQEVGVRHTWRRHMAIVEALVSDHSGSLRIVWFNQPYIAQTLKPGKTVNFAGKVSISEEGEIYLSHPAYETVNGRNFGNNEETRHTARLVPVYPETKGLTSRGLRFLIQPLLNNLESLPEWIPKEILEKYDLTEVNDALKKIHFPSKVEEALEAKKRFSFEDLFLLQLSNLKQKLRLAEEKAPAIKTDLETVKTFIRELPFELTFSQKKSLWEIIKDLEKSHPMNRLLQGDVGSGKTVVAAMAAFIAAQNGFQTAIMAPTEVLARQHFLTFKKLISRTAAFHQPSIGLLTSSDSKIIYETDLETNIKKTDLQKKIKSGEIKITIGTHALIQKSVGFKKLGLVVVDEQHRFGVRQRQALARGINAEQTQNNTEENSGSDNVLYKELTYKIRGALFEVKKALGGGHKENVYQKSVRQELEKRKVGFNEEKQIPIYYDGKKVGTYRPDFVIENKVILELKVLPFVGKNEKRQLWTYLRDSEYRLALLANYSPAELQIERVIYDAARSSASVPQNSAYVPHFLSMSATPIPRTLMLTVFGDLDISLITELPAGRKNIVTQIVPPDDYEKTYNFIRREVKRGRQVFVICPRIEPAQNNSEQTRNNAEFFPRSSASVPRSSALQWEVKSVKEEYEKLSKKIFPDLRVAMLHGQMKSKEKEGVMREFRGGRIDILVSTSVVEVGVDVPNAAIMMIEGAERFGLAQLYQFRGRVGRGEHQSYCFLFTNLKSANERLKAILEAKNGFELAERDLKIRGPGEFLGETQTGFSDLAMKALQDVELVKSSREAAAKILNQDQKLKKHPLLKFRLQEFGKNIHPE